MISVSLGALFDIPLLNNLFIYFNNLFFFNQTKKHPLKEQV